MEKDKKVVELDSYSYFKEDRRKYCLLPYIRLFAECDDFDDELIVKVIKEANGDSLD